MVRNLPIIAQASTESAKMIRLDDHDRRILALVQRNNQRSYDELGEELALSPSAVRRRLKRLRDEGVIVADVSLVDSGKSRVTVITSIRFVNESHAAYQAFKERMSKAKEVAQVYTVSGEADFVVIGHFSNMPGYEEWIDRHILSDDNIQRCDTNIVFSRVKYETAVDFDE